jgi:hypothetical protein
MRNLLSFFFVSICVSSCVDCKQCTYYEKTGQKVTYTETLDGEYCGDEIKAIEKKEFNNTQADEAYVTCQ